MWVKMGMQGQFPDYTVYIFRKNFNSVLLQWDCNVLLNSEICSSLHEFIHLCITNHNMYLIIILKVFFNQCLNVTFTGLLITKLLIN